MKQIIRYTIFLSMIFALTAKPKIEETERYLKITQRNFEEFKGNKAIFIFGIDDFDKERLEVKLFESKLSKKLLDNYKTKFDYKFENIGFQRRLNLASLSFDILRTDPLTNTSYKIDSVIIKYNFKSKIYIDNNSNIDFYKGILNTKQISSLIKNRINNKERNTVQSFNKWFKPELDYQKFYSIEDGIARINQSELIKKNNSLIGKNVENIIIYNRGNKINFYSNSTTIGNDKFLYLVVSHPYGDTSYYDYYNGKEPYFITYDPSETSEVYSLIDNNILGNTLEQVEIRNHYEKDEVYGNGVNVVETETSLCENWYFDEIRVQNEFNKPWEFFTDFTLFPVSDLELNYEYASNIFYLPENIHNKTVLNINTQMYDTVQNEGSGLINRDIIISNQNLLQGGNTLNLNSYRVVSDESTKDYNGIIGFDYFNVYGNVKPIAENGYFSFISQNDKTSNVTVEGFPDEFVVVVDTVNNTIQFPKTNKSNVLSISAKGKFSSIYYNKSINTSHDYGFHLVTMLGQNEIVRNFKDEMEFINYLDDISIIDDIALIINTDEKISSNVKNKIKDKFNSLEIHNSNNKYLLSIINNKKIESVSGDIFEKTDNGNYYNAEVNLLAGMPSRKIINSESTLQAVNLIPAKVKKITEGSYDAFYIYHPIFEPTIDKYIDYMSEVEDKSILKIDVEQLYDTYGYGIESPHSIKNFLQQSYNNWEDYPEFLTLVGDATWDPKKQKVGSYVIQLIPVYGLPYTDNYYGTLDGNDIIPELVIGRIPTNTNIEFENYLDKVKTYYEVPLNPWMKTILQIAGGDEGQKDDFKYNMERINERFSSSVICFDTLTISKANSETVSESQADDIKKEINEGKMWTNFLGHGSPSVIDMTGWEGPNLNNKGKYGVLNTLSCNTSAFAEPSQFNSIGEEFVNIKDKGFIASIGGTSTTRVSSALIVASSMYSSLLSEKDPERNIGRIYNSFKARNSNSPNTVNQVVLLGDPLITLRIAKQPELILYNKEVSIYNENNSSILTESNQKAIVDLNIFNLGTRTDGSVNFRAIHTFNNLQDTLFQIIDSVCYDANIKFEIQLNKSIGEHKLDLFVDYDSTNNDINYSNNNINLSFNVLSQGLLPVEPLENWNVSALNPIFRFVNPTGTKKDYNFTIKNRDGNEIYNSTSPNIYENFIELLPESLNQNERYILEYNTVEVSSGVSSSINELEFHTTSTLDSVVAYKTGISSSNIELLNLKKENNTVLFDDKKYGVMLSSARGSANAERHALINTYDIDSDSSLFSYLNRLRRGFNLVIIPDELNDSTSINLHFDTWDSKFNDEDIFKDSRLLDIYLNDSLKKGDYLLLATADVPMRAPDIIERKISPDSLGSSSRIINALKNLGGKYSDSLQFNSSYVFFTRIGYPETTVDYHSIGDTIQLLAELIRYQSEGNIKIKNIGNIKAVMGFDVNSRGNEVSFNSYLVDKKNDTILKSETENVDFNSFNTKLYPNFDYNLKIKRDSIGAKFEFIDFEFDFVPTPEIAVIKSKTGFEKSNYERGIEAIYNYSVENISTRSKSEDLIIDMNLENNFSTFTISDTTNLVFENSIYNNNISFETEGLGTYNELNLTVDPLDIQNELFVFNNTLASNVQINEDTTKPWLVAYADNITLNNNDYVHQKPTFIIELYDESPLEVIKDNVIFVRLNRKVMLENTTDSFNFEIVNEDDLKARLTFVSSTLLDIGENSIQVIGEDATGNHADTLDFSIYVSDKFETKNLVNYPNPFEVSTNFSFEYIGKENNIDVKLTIFDAIGSKISRIEDTANFGENKLKWNGLDDYGNSVSSGIYYYRLDLPNNASKPKFGRMIKVN